MSRTTRLAAAALFICASVGLASQANAGLSLTDPTVGEAMAAAWKAEVSLPEKAVTTVRPKPRIKNVVSAIQQKDRIRYPYVHGVAY